MQQTFPNLIEANFTFFDIFTGPILIEFIKRNPQLKRLTVHGDIHSSFWNDFDDTSSNLQYLHIARTILDFENEIKHLPKCFSKLRYLHIEIQSTILRAFINLLAENDVPIEILSVFSTIYIYDISDVIQKLRHIKGLRLLWLPGCELLKICKRLPTLKWLEAYLMDFNEMEIIEILKNYNHFSIFSIYIKCSITINTNFYYEFLNLTKNRGKLALSGEQVTNWVSESVLNMNENWLKIRSGWTSRICVDDFPVVAPEMICKLNKYN